MGNCLSTSVREVSLDSGTLGLRAWRHSLGSIQTQSSQVTSQISCVEWVIGLEYSVKVGSDSSNSLS